MILRKPQIIELMDKLDLNAVHGLEEKLTDDQHRQFRRELQSVVKKPRMRGKDIARATVSATASQRCEALLKTLNLWEP